MGEDYNHELAKPKDRQLMHLMRDILEAKGGLIKSIINVGISTNHVYCYMSDVACGFDNFGGIPKEFYNFVNNEGLLNL